MRWKDCEKDPPKQFLRIEIRDKQNKKYIGYRFGRYYFESFGNYVIKEPTYWRIPPKGSPLLSELKEKIHTIIEGEPAYDNL